MHLLKLMKCIFHCVIMHILLLELYLLRREYDNIVAMVTVMLSVMLSVMLCALTVTIYFKQLF